MFTQLLAIGPIEVVKFDISNGFFGECSKEDEADKTARVVGKAHIQKRPDS